MAVRFQAGEHRQTNRQTDKQMEAKNILRRYNAVDNEAMYVRMTKYNLQMYEAVLCWLWVATSQGCPQLSE